MKPEEAKLERDRAESEPAAKHSENVAQIGASTESAGLVDGVLVAEGAVKDEPARKQVRRVLASAVLLFISGYLGGLVVKALLPRPAVGYPLSYFSSGSDITIVQHPPLPPPLPPSVVIVEGWQLFFANGSYVLDEGQRHWLRRLSQAVQDCASFSLRVSGQASSAKFRKDSDNRNVGLANQRSEAVWNALSAKLGQQRIELVRWSSHDDLSSVRSFRDARRADSVENPAEFLNRRVDIELRKDSDCPFMVTSSTLTMQDSSTDQTAHGR